MSISNQEWLNLVKAEKLVLDQLKRDQKLKDALINYGYQRI